MKSRVAIIASPEKTSAPQTLQRAVNWVQSRANVVFAELTYESGSALIHRPDLLIVLGGDGTIITAAHGLGQRQIPIAGVNLGKLGFLAEFTIDQLEAEGEFLFSKDLPLTRRMMLDVQVAAIGGARLQTPAVNDCVILNGPPFRMIELRVRAGGDDVVEIRGDGLIVATPSGSTAHNLAAGGPILEPSAATVILTPICPHALTFRPLVIDARHTIEIEVIRGNPGTSAVVDGHISRALTPGDRITISRYPADFLLVRNPQHSAWDGLRRKLLWGQVAPLPESG